MMYIYAVAINQTQSDLFAIENEAVRFATMGRRLTLGDMCRPQCIFDVQ